MTKNEEIKLQIQQLEKKLKKWAYEYYELDKPTVDDQVYDKNYHQLLTLYKQFPEFSNADSITLKVGAQSSNKFAKVKHQYPMLSLDNAFDEEDLRRFDQHIKNQLGLNQQIEYICELKIDGLSISLLYENGKLKQALTRGDGTTGENVMANALMVKDIPKQINFQKKIEFRGEIFMTHEAFKNLNASSSQHFANARNAAAGTLRQLDADIVQKRNLSSFFYAIPNPLLFQLKTQSAVLKFISSLNLKTAKHFVIANGIEQVIIELKNLKNLKKTLNFDVDGLVIKVNNLTWYEDIGFTTKYPKAMIAYKFPEEIVSTKLLDIFVTIGRTGKVTYNAKLLPVQLGGSTVSFATLHNRDYVIARKINIGDEVSVKKSGEIIPRVLGVKVKHNNEQWVASTICPYCHEKLMFLDSDIDQYCVNNNCPERIIASLEHFCSKSAMNIVGLSRQTLQTFLDQKLITDLPSIYELYLQRQKIINLYRFKEKMTDNILQAIENSKNASLDKFIFSLGIIHVGAKVSAILARRFRSLEKIMHASESEISEILTLGPAVSKSLKTFFANVKNQQMIKRFFELGVKIKPLEAIKSAKLQNYTFVLTGELSKPRQFFQEIIESHSGNVSNAVSKNTDFVLAGLDAGSKLAKARELQIKIIDEKEFYNMINNHDLKDGSNG